MEQVSFGLLFSPPSCSEFLLSLALEEGVGNKDLTSVLAVCGASLSALKARNPDKIKVMKSD